jgi:hypothetical protein
VQVTNIEPTSDAVSTMPEDDANVDRVGLIAYDATVGGTRVASTSNPTTIEIELPEGSVTANELEVKLYDPFNGAYVTVGTAQIQEGSGKRNSLYSFVVPDICDIVPAICNPPPTYDPINNPIIPTFTFNIPRSPATTTDISITVNRNGNTGPLEFGYATLGTVNYRSISGGTSTPSAIFGNVPISRLSTGVRLADGTLVPAENSATCTACVVNLPQKQTVEPVSIEVTPRCSAGRAFKVGSLPSFSLSARRDGQGRPVPLDGVRPTINRVGGSQSAKAEVLSISVQTDALERGASYTVNGSVGNETIRESFSVAASGAASFEFETSSDTFCKDR